MTINFVTHEYIRCLSVSRNSAVGGSAVVIIVGGLIGLVALCVFIFGILLIMAWKKHTAGRRMYQFHY